MGWISRALAWRLDPILMRLSGGRLRFGLLLPTALLETRGARTGALRRNGVIYFHDGDRVVGTASALSFDLTVPGAILPAAGVTIVGVHPTHRRRGILRRLYTELHRRIADARYPIAALTASEGGIYGRFGYGPAIFFRKVDVNTRQARTARPAQAPGRVLLLDKAEAAKLLPAVYDRYVIQNCYPERPNDWWDARCNGPGTGGTYPGVIGFPTGPFFTMLGPPRQDGRA